MSKRKDPFDEVLHELRFGNKPRKEVFLSLPHNEQAEISLILTKHLLFQILKDLSNEEILGFISHLDPDDATDVLQILSKARQKTIIESLETDLKKSIETLLEFPSETAGGIMNIDYIQIDENSKIGDVANECKVHEKRTGRLPAILLTRNSLVTGYIPGHKLGFASPGEPAKKYSKRILSIKADAGHEEVRSLFRKHPHDKAVVLGEEGKVLGIIYSDDVLRLFHEHEDESLYDFAGVSDEENVYDSGFKKFKSRYKWLLINLGTAFLAASIVGLFEETIKSYVLLAVYMPIVAGMGGNAGTQTLAVMVRAIALGQINFSNALPAIKHEVTASVLNGILNGVVVSIILFFLHQDYRIGIILGLAMIINLVVAAFFGTIIPLIMKKIGKDPATSATIFITTATDVLGFLSFLGLATLLLN